MKTLFEIICFPVTFLIWFITFLFIAILCWDMFKRVKHENKNIVDLFLDFNIIIYRTYFIDLYFSIPIYVRTLFVLLLYYTIIYN